MLQELNECVLCIKCSIYASILLTQVPCDFGRDLFLAVVHAHIGECHMIAE